MDDKNLIKISAAVSVAGLVLLFFAVQLAEPRKIEIGSITQSDLGAIVEISGTVEKLSKSDGTTFITLNDGDEIEVVVFESAAKKMPLLDSVKEGKNVTFVGKISVYRSDLEIIASDLKVL